MVTTAEHSELLAQNTRLRAETVVLAREKAGLLAELAYVKRQLEALKRKLFGTSRGEQVSAAQLQLALAQLEQEVAAQTAAAKEVAAHTRRDARRAEAQARLPEDLETVTEEIIPAEVQARPEAYRRIGEEVTEEIDVVPMKVIRRRIVRPTYVRREQSDQAPITAALPPRVIPGGLPAAGLIAFLLVAKYVDHLPLYRLEKSFAQRFGVKLPRQRLCDWTGYAIDNWLSTIYHSIRQGLLGGDYLQIDETPIRYLDPGRAGQSARGYLWAFGRPGADLCFDWSVSRGRGAAEVIVRDFRGRLQSDGYAVYDGVCAERGIVQLGCWAHVRRKFYEAYQAGEEGAAHYVLLIRQLYEVERDLAADATPAQRVAERRTRSAPVLTQIESSISEDLARHTPKTAMAEALAYARSQWSKLIRFVEHGDVRLDNNLTEQAIRPTKLGMKNWLFIGHPDAGDRAAIIYTILECCRRHRVEPLAYLTDVLRRLPAMTNHQAAAANLSPRDWKPAA